MTSLDKSLNVSLYPKWLFFYGNYVDISQFKFIGAEIIRVIKKSEITGETYTQYQPIYKFINDGATILSFNGCYFDDKKIVYKYIEKIIKLFYDLDNSNIVFPRNIKECNIINLYSNLEIDFGYMK